MCRVGEIWFSDCMIGLLCEFLVLLVVNHLSFPHMPKPLGAGASTLALLVFPLAHHPPTSRGVARLRAPKNAQNRWCTHTSKRLGLRIALVEGSFGALANASRPLRPSHITNFFFGGKSSFIQGPQLQNRHYGKQTQKLVYASHPPSPLLQGLGHFRHWAEAQQPQTTLGGGGSDGRNDGGLGLVPFPTPPPPDLPSSLPPSPWTPMACLVNQMCTVPLWGSTFGATAHCLWTRLCVVWVPACVRVRARAPASHSPQRDR